MTIVLVVVVAGVGGWYFWSHPISTAAPAATTSGATVATVNGTPITQSQLAAAEAQAAVQYGPGATSTEAQAQIQSAALNSLIGRELVAQAAQRAGIAASATDVDTQLAAAKAQFQTPDEYQQALTAQGLTEDALRAQISEDLTLQAFLEQQLHLSAATTTEAEIQAAYNQVVAGQTNAPTLASVRDQIAQALVQQKQQASVNAYIDQLRAAADVQILIATSTPGA